jgi:hypothetical protein
VSDPNIGRSLVNKIQRRAQVPSPFHVRYITSAFPPFSSANETAGETSGLGSPKRGHQTHAVPDRNEPRVRSDPQVNPSPDLGLDQIPAVPSLSLSGDTFFGPNMFEDTVMTSSLRSSSTLEEDGTSRIIPGPVSRSAPRQPPAAASRSGDQSARPFPSSAQQQNARERFWPHKKRTPFTLPKPHDALSGFPALYPSLKADSDDNFDLFSSPVIGWPPEGDPRDGGSTSSSNTQKTAGNSSRTRSALELEHSLRHDHCGCVGNELKDDSRGMKISSQTGDAQDRALPEDHLRDTRRNPIFVGSRRHTTTAMPVRGILKIPRDSRNSSKRDSGLGTSSRNSPEGGLNVVTPLPNTHNAGSGDPVVYVGRDDRLKAARGLHLISHTGSHPSSVSRGLTSNWLNTTDQYTKNEKVDALSALELEMEERQKEGKEEGREAEEDEDFFGYTDNEAPIYTQIMRRINPIVPPDTLRQALADEAARIIVASCRAGENIRSRKVDWFSRAFSTSALSPALNRQSDPSASSG